MLRRSDIAPRVELFNRGTQAASRIIFATDNHVVFEPDGSALITIFGNKNDLQRTGFQERLPPHPERKLDPVGTFRDYIDRTASQRGSDKAVFLSLKKSPLIHGNRFCHSKQTTQ